MIQVWPVGKRTLSKLDHYEQGHVLVPNKTSPKYSVAATKLGDAYYFEYFNKVISRVFDMGHCF